MVDLEKGYGEPGLYPAPYLSKNKADGPKRNISIPEGTVTRVNIFLATSNVTMRQYSDKSCRLHYSLALLWVALQVDLLKKG